MYGYVPYSRKVWRIYLFWAFGEKMFGEWMDSAKKVIVVSINLNGFGLANQGWFTKFAKISPRQTLLLYGTYICKCSKNTITHKIQWFFMHLCKFIW